MSLPTFKLALFGGSRGVGLCTLKQALQRGHSVTCLVRNPANLPDDLRAHSNITIIHGDATDPAKVEETIVGSDAVIVSLGGHPTICSQAQPIINNAVVAHNQLRTVVVTSMGVGDSYTKLNWVTKQFCDWIIPNAIIDKNKQEASIVEQLTNWVIVRPGRLLDSVGTGKWNAGFDISTGSISREDVASFMLDECVVGDKWLKQAPMLVD
eukprot:TRINITY_DN19961_c0_g1_i1.p1 TRINITY_DN19961_c0_g1~~TRINITY_DN19961_c0_g1_i1.p1  ORF type:complete len:210 (-),score=35.82 TRINITY_DN19961_c0_g1_i1:30-659(-)